jgi:DHA1 family multidrug resistance protein-like MFS transporter
VNSPAEAAPPNPSALDEDTARYWRTTLSIALAAGLGSLSFNFWWPFMPLFLLELGASSEADAIFWIAIASTAQGVARLVTGPVWGVLSDRLGRKIMLLRALYFASGTTLIAAVINEPWQIALAFSFQGVFSGFIPAAVALTSVSVPDSRLNSSLSMVTGAQYIGNTLGPAIGAGLALLFDYRGAIFVAALLPSIAATAVLFLVPTDRVGSQARQATAGEKKEKLEPFQITLQFTLVIFLYFILFSLTQLLRLITPIALQQISSEGVAGVTGVAFTLGGLSSAFALVVVGRRFFRAGHMRSALVVSSLLTGGAHLLLAFADTVVLYVAIFALISLLEAAMIPATNTLIAGNASRARRGTAFGIASSAQAIAFMAGPMAAALFTAVSLDLGFVVLGGLFLGLGGLLLLGLREPSLDASTPEAKVKAAAV